MAGAGALCEGCRISKVMNPVRSLQMVHFMKTMIIAVNKRVEGIVSLNF